MKHAYLIVQTVMLIRRKCYGTRVKHKAHSVISLGLRELGKSNIKALNTPLLNTLVRIHSHPKVVTINHHMYMHSGFYHYWLGLGLGFGLRLGLGIRFSGWG